MKQQVLNLAQVLGFDYKKYQTVKFIDKQYKLIKGTLRTVPDKDDAWLFELSKHHKTVYDVGSNIGQAAMIMLYNDNVEKIVLIDPNPKALSWAAENLIMNNLSTNAHLVSAFISDKSGKEAELYTVGVGAAGSKYKSFAKTATKLNSHFTVQTLTLDDLSDKLELVPDLVKIDTEGAEYEVLNGSIEIAKKAITTFFVEMHSGPELSITKNTDLIVSWCRNNGYKAWYLKDKKPLTIDAIITRGRYHALLLPENIEFPSYLMDIIEGDSINLTAKRK